MEYDLKLDQIKIHGQTSQPPIDTRRSMNSKARDELFHSAIKGFKRESWFFFLNEEKFKQIDSLTAMACPRKLQTQGCCRTKVESRELLSSSVRHKTKASFYPTAPILFSPTVHWFSHMILEDFTISVSLAINWEYATLNLRKITIWSPAEDAPHQKDCLLIIDTKMDIYVMTSSRFLASNSSQVCRKCVLIKSTK